ncbi:hypothetical protein F5887DRAFT_975075 [Amanita rubescens]|nr:hypothetical protein F5887DRAFT_975075 [Amanita rubescens]
MHPYHQDAVTRWSQILEFPTEILQQIFLLVARSSWNEPCTRSSVMSLSHVCSRWRQIALGYPPLWSLITTADLCNRRWMNTVVQRSKSCPLSINFRSMRSSDEQLDTCRIPFIHGAKEISLVSDYQMFLELQSSEKWASSLETLRICVENVDDYETPSTSALGSDYIARLDEQHLPNLPFFGQAHKLEYVEAPHLRHLSLTNCYTPRAMLKSSPNLERLELSHRWDIWSYYNVSDWTSMLRCLPHLTFLSIDGAMRWDLYDPRKVHNWRTEALSITKLADLRINRCSLGCATLIRIFSPPPRSLQLSFTDVRYDDEFTLFCDAMQSWFRSWGANTPNPYLYVSIQPDGIIVHNRSTRQKCVSMDEQDSPSLQLALSWRAEYAGEKGLDLISPLLNLVSTTEPHPDSMFHSPTSPLTRGCEELELSIGLFDYEDKAFRTVTAEFFRRFADVKILTCVGGAGAVLAPLASQDEQVEHPDLFPLLESLCFDHVQFKDGLGQELLDFLRLRTHPCQPVGHVELNGCYNVGQNFVTSLQRANIQVVLGEGTVLVDNDNCGRNKKRTREPWTKDQVKLLMKNWAASAR